MNPGDVLHGNVAILYLMTDYLTLGTEHSKNVLNSLQLDFYYKQLYGIVRFVAESELLKTKCKEQEFLDRYYYMTQLRVNLSDEEWNLVYIRVLQNPFGGKKFKYYIEEYALLKDVANREQINTALERDGHHFVEQYYKETAFGIDEKLALYEAICSKK